MRRFGALGLLLAACMLLLALPGAALGASDGKVHFFKSNSSATDHMWSSAHDAGPGASRDFLTSNYSRSWVWTPFFNRFTEWYKGAWPYKDAYAIYPWENSGTKDRYILRDGQGQRMYIAFQCHSDGTCPQYAADITNPAWRSAWIDEARTSLAGGDFKGIAIDDVNFDRKVCGDVGASCEESVTPVNYRGEAVTLEMWKDAMADFMEEVRAAFPGREIVHNQVFFFAGGLSGGVPVDPNVRRGIAAADLLYVERGYLDANFNDSSFGQLRDWVRYAHSQGKGVILDAKVPEDPDFALASYFLDAKEGVTDYLGHPYRSAPGDWWDGWQTDLGKPLQPEAYGWPGYWRRDYERGSVTVTGPRSGSIQHGAASQGSMPEIQGWDWSTMTWSGVVGGS